MSAVVTFHREGVLVHATLRSYIQSRSLIRLEGGDVELVLVLDNADEATRQFVLGHPELDGSERLLEVNVGDPALARNAGIAESSGEHICILDGDDLISRRYFSCHIEQILKLDRAAILHPEMVLSFGMYNAFNWQIDQAGPYFDMDSLLCVNPWVSAAFAHRSVFEAVPYRACSPRETGFGFEDWYWNCETISRGLQHRLAWGSTYFYRRKLQGSLNEASISMKTMMPKTTLFDRPEWKQANGVGR